MKFGPSLSLPRDPLDRRLDLGQALDERSREIFRLIVDSYLESGEPVGSRNLRAS